MVCITVCGACASLCVHHCVCITNITKALELLSDPDLATATEQIMPDGKSRFVVDDDDDDDDVVVMVMLL